MTCRDDDTKYATFKGGDHEIVYLRGNTFRVAIFCYVAVKCHEVNCVRFTAESSKKCYVTSLKYFVSSGEEYKIYSV
jgi:hypothetical protein